MDKNQNYTEQDSEYFSIASDYMSKQIMVCMDLLSTFERIGLSEDDATQIVRTALVDFSENGVKKYDLAKSIFNFVENVKKYSKNIKAN
jgi:hypothetical protein